MSLLMPVDGDGPSSDELASIEVEWPLIAAELDLLDAEIRVLTAAQPSELDLWRVRRARARARVTRAARAVAAKGFAPVGGVAA